MTIATQLDWDAVAELRTEEAVRLQEPTKRVIIVDLTDLPDRKTLPTGRVAYVPVAEALADAIPAEAPVVAAPPRIRTCADCGEPLTGHHLRKWCDPCAEKRRNVVPEKAGTWTKTCECGVTFEASGKGAHFVKLCPTCKAKKKTDLGEEILAPCNKCSKLFPRKLREKQNFCEEHR